MFKGAVIFAMGAAGGLVVGTFYGVNLGARHIYQKQAEGTNNHYTITNVSESAEGASA